MTRANRPPLRRCQGLALITVLVVLAICLLIVTASARSGLLHEMLTGHQSDQQRARIAAEALVVDAQIDILGMHPDGRPCRTMASTGEPHPDFIGCRQRGSSITALAPYFPQSTDEFEEARALLQVGAAIPCRDGICFPSSLEALVHIEEALESMKPTAAIYGQFTRADSAEAGSSGNPVLTDAVPRGWYWVEAFRHEADALAAASQAHLLPDPTRPFVYRITAVAEGLKPGTRAVIKTFFVPYPSSQLQ
jgi:type IV pilus assembly protein PilX